MRVTRRVLVVLLAGSFAAAIGLLLAAVVHEPFVRTAEAGRVLAEDAIDRVGSASPGHRLLEAGLWLGAVAAGLVFATSFGAFRREVRTEKRRRRAERARRALLREARNYLAGRPRGPRPNN